MRRRVTAADVARLSGVSRATVSYVLNDVPGQTIPAATRERVRDAAARLAYVPSAAAASLRRGHSRIVVVVTERALSGFVTEPFLRAISDRLAEEGLVPVTHQHVSDDALHALLDEIRPYGVIALTALSEQATERIVSSGVPHVYSSAHGDPSFPRPWEEEIGQLQAEHLIARGAQRLIYAGPTVENPRAVMARSREIGAARACTTAGLPLPRQVDVPHDRGRAVAALAPLIERGGGVGICAFDDEVAVVVLAVAEQLGLSVPGDVGVIGVDNAPFGAFLAPPLTTVSIDAAGSGRSVVARFLGDSVSAGADASSRTYVIHRSST